MKRRVIIRPPVPNDCEAFLKAAQASRRLYRSWVFPPATPEAFQVYIQYATTPPNCGFVVCTAEDGQLVGVINIGHMVMGMLSSAHVGYYGFAQKIGQGLMREGMALVIAHAFRKLKLHRLEANIQPANEPSVRFARACGFVREGYSRRYLKVGRKWQDHERWALLEEDWKKAQRSTRPRRQAA